MTATITAALFCLTDLIAGYSDGKNANWKNFGEATFFVTAAGVIVLSVFGLNPINGFLAGSMLGLILYFIGAIVS